MLLKVLDIFSGAGGLSLGFELARNKNGRRMFRTFMAVDNDKYACQTFKKNFPHTYVLEGDITKKSVHSEIISKCKGKVNVIIGGPPCQPFSTIGPRSGYGVGNKKFEKDKRMKLYLEYVRLVRELKPDFIVMENVRGIMSKKNGHGTSYVAKIIKSLERFGYSFEIEGSEEKFQILNSVHFGVPQRRERVFIIGNRRSIKNPLIKKTHYDPETEKSEDGLERGFTIRDAIADLPRLKAKMTLTGIEQSRIDAVMELNEKINNGSEEMEYTGRSVTDNEFMHFVFSGGLTGKQPSVLRDHIARPQQFTDIKLFGLMKPGETAKDFMNNGYKLGEKKLIKYSMTGFFDKYRKQKWNAPCTTLFAHLEKDGNRFIHPDGKQARTITVREAARIQSFPDDFVFECPYNRKYRQIGNSVPPLMAKSVAESLSGLLS